MALGPNPLSRNAFALPREIFVVLLFARDPFFTAIATSDGFSASVAIAAAVAGAAVEALAAGFGGSDGGGDGGGERGITASTAAAAVA